MWPRIIFLIFFLVSFECTSKTKLNVFTSQKSLARVRPSNGRISFKLRARNDAYIVLAKGPEYADGNVRVLLGKDQNCFSEMQKDTDSEIIARVETPGILRSDVFKDFWINWECGTVSVGFGGNTKPFLVGSNKKLTHVTHIGFGTGWGSTGDWLLENGDVISTTDVEGEFVFLPNLKNEFKFQYRGNGPAIIGFQRDENEKFDPLYEFRLGVANNGTWISKSDENKAYKETVNLLQQDEFRTFRIVLEDGLLLLELDGDDHRRALKWLDREPREIRQIMLGNSEGHRSSWLIDGCSLIDLKGRFV